MVLDCGDAEVVDRCSPNEEEHAPARRLVNSRQIEILMSPFYMVGIS